MQPLRSASLTLVICLVCHSAGAQDVLIHITGPGSTAKFIKHGDTMQLPVNVKVGQTVRFANDTGTTTIHNATGRDPANPGAPPVFKTDDIPIGGHKDIVFNAAIFAAAGGNAGGSIDIPYVCTHHPATMKSKIVLQDASTEISLRVRKNVANLTAAEVTSLRHGVEVMRSRPASNRTSWKYWANIHGMLGSTTDPVLKQCKHGTIDFLVWHRAYLYHFERVLRDASGDPALTLPYWDWTNQPALPAIYRDPVGVNQNSLYDPARQMNDPTLSLPSEVVSDDLTTAFNEITYFKLIPQPPFGSAPGGFAGSLDLTPHGTVHTLVGGQGGTMSIINTSANDPIFWAHHTNVDRIWDRWLGMGGGRQNPSDPTFLNRVYTFVGTDGADATITAQNALSATALGYRYDDISPEGTTMPPAQLLATTQASEAANKLALDNVTVTLDVVSAGAEALGNALSEGPTSERPVTLRVKDVAFQAIPSFTYGVYLQLPDSETSAEKLKLHYVGSLSFFAREKDHGHGESSGPIKFTQTFNVTKPLVRLRAAGVNFNDKIKVTLRPITLKSSQSGESASRARDQEAANKAGVTFSGVDLVR